MLLSLLHGACVAFLVCLLLLGSFSRFTDGRFTRSFHAFQLDRNDDEQLRYVIPAVDLCLALLLLPRLTRPVSAALIALAMSGGLYMRVAQQHKDATLDVLQTAVAFAALFTSLAPLVHVSKAHPKTN